MVAQHPNESLDYVVERIAVDDLKTAHKTLKRVLREHETQQSPDAIKHFVFGAALARRLSPKIAEETNLYLSDFDIPQIELFNLLARHMPLVSRSGDISNHILAQFCQGRDEVTLIDIGIGTGRQMVALLDILAERPDRPKTITVVGIEPAGLSLEMAGRNLEEAARRNGFDLIFCPIRSEIECLSTESRHLLREIGSKPVVNASFALHHIRDIDGHDVRTPVMGLLRSLDPAVLVLAEPHVDHLEPDLTRRYHNCWNHFGLTFEVIDKMPVEQHDKDALKVCFFGREVRDILGMPEEERTERHETASSWLRRLRTTGFRPHNVPYLDEQFADGIIQLSQRDGYIGLDYHGETIVAVLCVVPDDAMSLPLLDLPRAAPRSGQLPRALDRPRSLDAGVYLAALVAIARADHIIHEKERPFIERQARFFDISSAQIWDVGSLDEVLARAGELSEHTREAILRDTVLLAMLDGEYVEAERVEVRAIARKLGFDDAKVKRTEELSRVYLPSELSAAPSWFRALWALGAKHNE
ncbi:MAG: hypothetical protein MJE77_25270 [Proteobacteria bacterium]|nr:hypothetical protein [Pseudomonadota bacterium]